MKERKKKKRKQAFRERVAETRASFAEFGEPWFGRRNEAATVAVVGGGALNPVKLTDS
jgi:hypothetical protein